MGMFWRITQGNYHPDHTITLCERKGTLSADWPFVWRWAQYHYLIEIKQERHKNGYYLFAASEKDGTLRYHSLIRTRYAMVTVGPEQKDFWAETRDREVLSVVYTGLRRAGFLVRNKDQAPKSVLKKHTDSEEITWT